MVEQPARGCDQDVDAAGQFTVLVAERNAADQERDVEFLTGAVFVKTLLDLGCELAGRLEDQGAGHSGPGAALFEHGEHRQDEGGSLAGAGLGDAENVSAVPNLGDCLILNGGGGGGNGGPGGRQPLFRRAMDGTRKFGSVETSAWK